MVYALLMHEEGNPAERDAEADRPGRRNPALAEQIRRGWEQGRDDSGATRELLGTLRQGTADEAAARVVELLQRGAGPQSIWDGLFCGAGELLLRQPGIVALHAVTTTNAIHYAFRASGEEATRKLLLLQNAAFLPLFREALRGRGAVRDAAIEELEPESAAGGDAVADVFAEVPRNRLKAARRLLAYGAGGGPSEPLLATARQLLVKKGNDAHDFKFGAAVLEDYAAVSASWRNRFLAASLMQLCGSGGPDSPLRERTRAALAG